MNVLKKIFAVASFLGVFAATASTMVANIEVIPSEKTKIVTEVVEQTPEADATK